MTMEQSDISLGAKAALTQYMEENNLRKTVERYAVLQAAHDIGTHFTSDELCDYMSTVFRVSRGTVYNTLELLSKARLVAKHHFADVVRYEYSYGMKPHIHQVCVQCGSVKDVFSDDVDKAFAHVKLPRFRSYRYDACVYGMCAACSAKNGRMRVREANKDKKK